ARVRPLIRNEPPTRKYADADDSRRRSHLRFTAPSSTSRRKQAAQLEDRREAGRAAEYHIALASRRGGSARVRSGGADDQVVDAVSVDVACTADRRARGVERSDPIQDEALAAVAAAARQQAPQVESGRKTRR